MGGDHVEAVVRACSTPSPCWGGLEGWAFEGFFEARDTEGVPVLAVFNYWRGPDRGGGQWARSEDLYPYAHG